MKYKIIIIGRNLIGILLNNEILKDTFQDKHVTKHTMNTAHILTKTHLTLDPIF